MYFIHPIYPLAALLLLASCSTRRQTNQSIQHSESSTARYHRLADSSLQSTITGSLLLHQHDQLLLTEITPSGTYQADSGYHGEASRIVLYRQSSGQTLRQDSTRVRQQSGSKAQQQTLHTETAHQSSVHSTKYTEPMRLPYWPVAVVVAAGIAYGILIWRIPAWLRKN